MELKGKIALVTGSAKRVGRAISLGLASSGCQMALHYLHSAAEARRLRRQVREKDVAADIFKADLGISTQIGVLIEEVTNRFGRIDVLINNAAVCYATPWGNIKESDWDLFMDTNLKSTFLLSQAVSQFMLSNDGGKIIHLADIGGFRPWPGYVPYCVSKAGVIALTQGMAKALAPSIQVNAIAPATVLPSEDSSEEEVERLRRQIPLDRIGSPEDIVQTVLYLLGGTDFITGQVVVVDGGRSIY